MVGGTKIGSTPVGTENRSTPAPLSKRQSLAEMSIPMSICCKWAKQD